MERVIFLKEVTQSDLGREFLCFAQNSIGNVTRSLRLQEKRGGELVVGAGCTHPCWVGQRF